ncbi:hypothetical protein BDQ12DRAFT_666303 [Crucibulum laeve]|uniref:NACHT domain-containing protein n=1 Tax=Crucibulum laeve TaxID=68775 RepID=A0A5C3LZV3_9AGAR|nr:hypothetical protein BDQ12DRAFT_666303 [Crucibulum laeve]
MSFFQNYSNVVVNGSTMNDIRGNQINNYNAPRDLYHIFSPIGDASYTRPGPVARCHPGTRLKVITEIEKWIKDSNDCPILWLNGPAGTGKSAISQTIAECYASQKQVAASFFFFRGSGRRSTIQHLISTLAYQVSMFDPAAKSMLIDTMSNEPNLHEQALHYQLNKLLINPIRATRLEWSKIIIIIDALDECDDKELISDFIEAIVDICNASNVQLPFKLLLTSCVEEHIQEQFYNSATQSVIKYLALQKFDATEDIELYLESRLSLLYKRKFRIMYDIPGPWPSKEHLKRLSRNAAGSFIIASTVVKFIEKAKGHPDDNLKEALYMTNGLDPVYHQVITTALQENKTLQNKQLHILERVLAVIVIAKEPLSVSAISVLLEIKAYHIAQMLLGLQAILLIPEKDNDEPFNFSIGWLYHTISDILNLKGMPIEINDILEDFHMLLKVLYMWNKISTFNNLHNRLKNIAQTLQAYIDSWHSDPITREREELELELLLWESEESVEQQAMRLHQRLLEERTELLSLLEGRTFSSNDRVCCPMTENFVNLNTLITDILIQWQSLEEEQLLILLLRRCLRRKLSRLERRRLSFFSFKELETGLRSLLLREAWAKEFLLISKLFYYTQSIHIPFKVQQQRDNIVIREVLQVSENENSHPAL